MPSKVVLIIEGAGGVARRGVVVSGARFQIGRAAGNDLRLDAPGIAERHAIISTILGATFVTDCGSRGGTTLNGRRLNGRGQLRDGDVIGLAGAYGLKVKVVPGALAGLYTLLGSRAVVIAVAGALALIALMVLTTILFNRTGPTGQDAATGTAREKDKGDDEDASDADKSDADKSDETSATANAGAHTSSRSASGVASAPDRSEADKLESAAIQVLHRISRDDKSYALDDATLEDIGAKVRSYGTSAAMSGALRQMQAGMGSVVAGARREGLEPALIVFAGLATTDGGRNGRDPSEAARALLPELAELSKTFGSVDADSSLIILAAHTEGAGTKRSHPLLSKVRRSVRNPLAERNVWYLHEHGLIGERAYDFVVSFLACGIIAQDPKRFGVDADALSL
jgi:pSer/pThr/pTyr-binding forkhead associated (FHA) protein